MSCRSCTAATTRCSSPRATRPGVRAAAPGSARADNAARSCQLCERMPSGAHGGAWGFAPAGLRGGHGGARGSGWAEGGALQSRAAPTTFVTSDKGFACGEHPQQEHHDRCAAPAGMSEAVAAAALRRRPMAPAQPGPGSRATLCAGAGMPVLEGMASGLPVVASRCLGIQAFAHHDANALLANPQVLHQGCCLRLALRSQGLEQPSLVNSRPLQVRATAQHTSPARIVVPGCTSAEPAALVSWPRRAGAHVCGAT
jgi:hypothetical protein